jgi:tRNA-dihydrouridine synthase
LGFYEVDHAWHQFLLDQKLNMLTIHGRTKKEMSKVPAHWDDIAVVRQLRDDMKLNTLIVGNGDVIDRAHGEALARQHGLDGIMIGRGVFNDPFVFAKLSPWATYTKSQRIALFRRHVKLFANTWQPGERPVHTLNKFCKVYIQNFDGAKELREQLMAAETSDELLSILAKV